VTRNTEPGVPAPGFGSTRKPPSHRRDEGTQGVEGNAKLTAMTGAILLIGFAVEGFTILELHRLMVLHFIVGFLLIGPVLLKIGTTGYRFVRYYTGSAPYVRRGPPSPLLRVLGPLVILTSVAVIGTGVILAVVGPGNGPWLFLHKASFILWFGVMTIHVLNYAPQLPRMLAARSHRGGQRQPLMASGSARWLALVVAVAVGVGVAALATHLSAQWNVFG
jgi:hypothetical protein